MWRLKMLDIEQRAKEIEDRQSKCEHKWEFIPVVSLPHYKCILCDKRRYIDYDENGNVKN